MEYQILNDNIVLNKNKDIGKVVYIVEGTTREINIIANVFQNILGYTNVASLNRNGKRKYKKLSKEENPNSQIIIINSETSNIKTITNTEFIDKQFEILKENGLAHDYRNSAIYYIFDADRKEDINNIKELINNYTNSREPNAKNKYDTIGGMLLLSYPAIETFMISNFEKDMYKFNDKFNFKDKTLKQYVYDCKYNDKDLSTKTIKNAFCEMIKSLRKINIDKINLDNTAEFNNEIFKFETENNKQYMLSLLLVSFLDLGIIEIS